jgi:3-oxoacyl-ACP reductase-like protein
MGWKLVTPFAVRQEAEEDEPHSLRLGGKLVTASAGERDIFSQTAPTTQCPPASAPTATAAPSSSAYPTSVGERDPDFPIRAFRTVVTLVRPTPAKRIKL